MKGSTKVEVLSFLNSKAILNLGDAQKIYEIYAESEIQEYKDLFNKHKDLVFLIYPILEYKVFGDCTFKEFTQNLRTIVLGLSIIGSEYFNFYKKNQVNFARQIESIVGFNKMVKILLPNAHPKTADEADAIAIALAHTNMMRIG